MSQKQVTVIGAGLAGSEAAWQLAKRGWQVDLFEMRPKSMTPAHKTEGFAELVCSNSFGSETEHSASRILKDELSELGAYVLSRARECRVPAGASLAVDRDLLSQRITQELMASPHVRIHREEVCEVPREGITVIASGPLTSPALSEDLAKRMGAQSLYFYDAISPIVATESLDLSKMFFANRYDKGDSADFLNIPLDKTTYENFVADLLAGDVVLPHEFEEAKYFESCLPIETIASRGPMTLAFGPMKPVGLTDPKTGRRSFAVIQLRAENNFKTAYNLVGFQTKLKYKEQERIFRKLPGLENAEFLRLGSMHRNTFIDSPKFLLPTLQLRNDPNVFIAGQLTGTEGYLESTASGCLAGINAARVLEGKEPLTLPTDTMLGALFAAITDSQRKDFQPMNVNMGLLPPAVGILGKDKKARHGFQAQRALDSLRAGLRASHSL